MDKKHDQYAGFHSGGIPFLPKEICFEHPTKIYIKEKGITTIENIQTGEILAVFSGNFNIIFKETITR